MGNSSNEILCPACGTASGIPDDRTAMVRFIGDRIWFKFECVHCDAIQYQPLVHKSAKPFNGAHQKETLQELIRQRHPSNIDSGIVGWKFSGPDECKRGSLSPVIQQGRSAMPKIPPVYSLYFTNQLGFELKNEFILDAASDQEAVEKAQGLLVLNPNTAAILCADQRIIRQFTPQGELKSDLRMKRRARDLSVRLRESETNSSSNELA